MYIDNPELQKKKAQATKEKREKIVFGDKPYRCQKCGILKDTKDFVIHWLDSYWVGKYRYLYECKQCKKDRVNKKRSSQRETIDTALDIIYKQLKQGAKKRQIPFEISLSDLQNLREKQGGNCYYSGYTMTFEYMGNKEGDMSEKTKYQVSCDRINNSIGYIPGNIVLCCTIVNNMKNICSQKEFYQICKDISTKHK